MIASLNPLPKDVRVSLDLVLGPDENVLGSVTSLAGTLVLTGSRVLIVREGRGYRPQSGVRSWRISRAVNFSYGAMRGGLGRLMIGNGKDATSFFVRGADWDEALRLVTMAHGIAHRGASPARGMSAVA